MKINLLHLLDETLCSVRELFNGILLPPIHNIAIRIKLSPFIIESYNICLTKHEIIDLNRAKMCQKCVHTVSDFMCNEPTDRCKIQIRWPEEDFAHKFSK